MPHLQELAEGIWTASAPHRWIGLHLGTRMTVIRLSRGGLLLHSPVPMSKQLRTRLYLKLAGLYGRIGWSRFLRILYRDRKAARASVDRLLQWPFERVVISHGNIISEHARETVRRAFGWL